MPLDRQRIDKWLWHARVAPTRSAAAALAASGRVRVNGTRVEAASRPVKPGDVVTIALDTRVRVLSVVGFALRRGPAEAARSLYEEQTLSGTSAQTSVQQPDAARSAQSGRPTKRDRRAIDRFTGGEKP